QMGTVRAGAATVAGGVTTSAAVIVDESDVTANMLLHGAAACAAPHVTMTPPMPIALVRSTLRAAARTRDEPAAPESPSATLSASRLKSLFTGSSLVVLYGTE